MYRTVRQLKGILKTSLDVIICTNTKGEFTLVSDSSLNLFGYRPEEMMGRNVSDFIHPEDLNKTTGFRQQLMEGHEAFYFENRYIRKDGAIAYVEWSARWSMEEEAIYAIARDASPKKKYEESI
ncbi:MAG TPA: PAS domain S-box protein, partial [Flavisolibacter sp.]|nr:PAS domain S-box protein [Flavisolibacter sp.]